MLEKENGWGIFNVYVRLHDNQLLLHVFLLLQQLWQHHVRLQHDPMV